MIGIVLFSYNKPVKYVLLYVCLNHLYYYNIYYLLLKVTTSKQI